MHTQECHNNFDYNLINGPLGSEYFTNASRRLVADPLLQHIHPASKQIPYSSFSSSFGLRTEMESAENITRRR